MYGLTTPNADRTAMVSTKKPTKFVSNGAYILAELCVRCVALTSAVNVRQI